MRIMPRTKIGVSHAASRQASNLTDCAWLVIEYALFAALLLLMQFYGWRPNASALP